jgi:hypothetical protein
MLTGAGAELDVYFGLPVALSTKEARQFPCFFQHGRHGRGRRRHYEHYRSVVPLLASLILLIHQLVNGYMMLIDYR